MCRKIFVMLLLAFVPLVGRAGEKGKPVNTDKPRVRLETTKGVVVLELEPAKAPLTVKNFLTYVREGFYDGTIFHRVIPNFMIQGGGFTKSMEKKAAHASIKNEAGNGLQNLRGTVAMARTSQVDSANSQFFINVVDNPYLDHRDESPRGYGYCVFAKVIEGMDVVDAIAKVRTGSAHGMRDVPVEPVVITRATVVETK